MISISRYSSVLSTEKPYFDTEEAQKREVSALVQANEDLMKEYIKIKKNLEHTNLNTEVEIKGEKYKISDLLVIKRKMSKSMIRTFESLTERDSLTRMSSYRSSEGERPKIVRMYKEEDKNEGLNKWQDIYDNIDSRLEVVNATHDLLEIE